MIGCGVVAILTLPTLSLHWRLAEYPGPPPAAEIGAAAGQVSERQAQLGEARSRLSAVSAQLTTLRTQAEVLTERYDQTLVDEQRALAAYHAAQARLASAERAQGASQRAVAGMAAQEYESGGGITSLAAMVGDDQGPRAYLNRAGLSQMLAQYETGALAKNQANHVVAGVFRTQAHDLFMAQQDDLRAAQDLKVAIEAAVSRQVAFVRIATVTKGKAAVALVTARAHEAALRAARQAALREARQAALQEARQRARQAARQAALAARATRAARAARAAGEAAAARATAAGGPSTSVETPSWSAGSGAPAGQGEIAANWALSQMGKPYLWGGAGPAAYDCSGLTMMAWAHAGVSLLHWTGYQWLAGPHVPLGQLRRGDLIFFAANTSDAATIHHVGIYIGHDQMVDAPYTGASVRIDSIYQPGGLIGAVRPAD